MQFPNFLRTETFVPRKEDLWEACDVGLRVFPPGSSDLMEKLLGEPEIKDFPPVTS